MEEVSKNKNQKPSCFLHFLIFSKSALFIFINFIYLSSGLIPLKLNSFEPFYTPKDNKLISSPNHFTCNGKPVHRCEVDIVYYECCYYFLENEPYNPVDQPLVDVNLTVENLTTTLCPISSIYCEKLNLYYLKNAYVRHPLDIVLSNGDYFMLYVQQTRWDFMKPTKQYVYASRGYRCVLFAPSIFWYGYGHWFSDVLAGLILLPQWVWDMNPVFPIVADYDLVKFTLTLIGHGDVDIVYSLGYVYAENLFLISGYEEWHAFGMHSYYVLKQKFHDYLKLNEIKPVNYYFRNKKPGRRHFINLEDIMNLTRQKTGLDWKMFSMSFRQRVEFAKELATIKIIVMPAGSICFNTIYMHDGTGLVTLLADSIDFPQFMFCHCVHVWNIAILHEHMGHSDENGSGYGNAERIVENIKRMIYTVEHQHYPPDHNLFYASNITEAKNAFYQYKENEYIDYNVSVNHRYHIYRNNKLLNKS